MGKLMDGLALTLVERDQALSLVLTSNSANNELLTKLIDLGATPVYGFSPRTNQEAVIRGLNSYPAALDAFRARGTENPASLVKLASGQLHHYSIKKPSEIRTEHIITTASTHINT